MKNKTKFLRVCSYFLFINNRIQENKHFSLPSNLTRNDEILLFHTKLKDITELANGLVNGDAGYRYLYERNGDIEACCIKFSFEIDEKEKLIEIAQRIVDPLLHAITFTSEFVKPTDIIGWFFILDNEPINYTEFKKLESKSTIQINEYTFSEIKNLTEKFASFNRNLKFNIAINRYAIGLTAFFSPRPIEGIVDLMIALEAVMAEKGDNLKYKISMRSAKFIGKDKLERKKIFLLFKAFYDIRSDIVHGENYDQSIILKRLNAYAKFVNIEKITINEAIKEFSIYVRKILLLILDKQITECSFFDDLLLE